MNTEEVRSPLDSYTNVTYVKLEGLSVGDKTKVHTQMFISSWGLSLISEKHVIQSHN